MIGSQSSRWESAAAAAAEPTVRAICPATSARSVRFTLARNRQVPARSLVLRKMCIRPSRARARSRYPARPCAPTSPRCAFPPSGGCSCPIRQLDRRRRRARRAGGAGVRGDEDPLATSALFIAAQFLPALPGAVPDRPHRPAVAAARAARDLPRRGGGVLPPGAAGEHFALAARARAGPRRRRADAHRARALARGDERDPAPEGPAQGGQRAAQRRVRRLERRRRGARRRARRPVRRRDRAAGRRRARSRSSRSCSRPAATCPAARGSGAVPGPPAQRAALRADEPRHAAADRRRGIGDRLLHADRADRDRLRVARHCTPTTRLRGHALGLGGRDRAGQRGVPGGPAAARERAHTLVDPRHRLRLSRHGRRARRCGSPARSRSWAGSATACSGSR